MPLRVLIAPLHWGLGHATRCIPLIREQLNLGNEVVVAAKGGPRTVIQGRFPQLKFVDIPFMEITYPADGNMVRHFFWRGPRLLKSIWREHRVLQRVVASENINLVISDSRFGLWSSKCKSVFVSHQIQIRSPRLQGVINMLNRCVMNRYDEVWIPDYENAPGLAGELSHPANMPRKAKFIGPLSRFEHSLEKRPPIWDSVAIISGPEPQRSRFETELVRQFVEDDSRALVLRGKPGEGESREIGKLVLHNHLEDEALINALSQTRAVIARSGYSTIMDMHVLGLQATYIPTPGQTEQEYLSTLHGNNQSL